MLMSQRFRRLKRLEAILRALIGSTGFVGTNLRLSAGFDRLYNSSNIGDLPQSVVECAICAAAPATMWAANADPEGDLDNINKLISNIDRSRIRRMVLISTIAVYSDVSAGFDENVHNYENSKAYGKNRRYLEVAIQNIVPKVHVMRLPALFGVGLKKNFIFDILNPIPSYLNAEAWDKMKRNSTHLEISAFERSYVFEEHKNMWKLLRDKLSSEEVTFLNKIVKEKGMSASLFTNEKSQFQYYDLSKLREDIDSVINKDIGVINICSYPLVAADIYYKITGERFNSKLPSIYKEDVRSIYAGSEDWEGTQSYLYSSDFTLQRLGALRSN